MFIDAQQLAAILCTSSLTILGGVIVFAVSQFIDKFTIEPLNRFEKTRGEINYYLLFFANAYVNPETIGDEEILKLFSRLRELASRLIADIYTIHGFWLFRLFGRVPPKRDVILATNQMFLLPTHFQEGNINVVEIQNVLHKTS